MARKPRVLTVDESRCLACQQCMTECALAHSDAANLVEAMRSGQAQPRLHVEAVGHFGMPIQCRHCEDAPCAAVCPTEAIYRPAPHSPVLLDADRCIGCRSCMYACPFGVIDMAREGKAVVKCDLCIRRTAQGEEPACVAGCPTKAIQFRELDDWLAQRRHEAAKLVAAGNETPNPSEKG
ncbi:MAG: 4Fe-4S dicluster domain-containing protein [Planctomycetota bacterium]|nr:4Fe-4S dicluster domain-containing protein [Planctomycetota bacterium]